MPPVPGAEKAFYADPTSTEFEDLDRRWQAGEFLARTSGALMFHDGTIQPTALFVPDGCDPIMVSGLLAMNHKPQALAYFAPNVEWRD